MGRVLGRTLRPDHLVHIRVVLL
jgi:hypothetical protein